MLRETVRPADRLQRDREIGAAFLPRLALAAMSASSKNLRRPWLQHSASIIDCYCGDNIASSSGRICDPARRQRRL
jgi:hypothetical protein